MKRCCIGVKEGLA